MDPAPINLKASMAPPESEGEAEALLARLARVRKRDGAATSPALPARSLERLRVEPKRVASVTLDQLTRQASHRKQRFSFARSAIAVGIGIAATLAWQSYNETATRMVTAWSSELSSRLAAALPQSPSGQSIPDEPTTAVVQAENNTMQPTAGAALASAEPQPIILYSPALIPQLDAMANDVVTMRQQVDQLRADQQQAVLALSRVQSAQQDILQKITAPVPRPSSPPIRGAISPVPARQAQSSPPVPSRQPTPPPAPQSSPIPLQQ